MFKSADSIVSIVRTSAFRYGDKPCIVTPERTMTFQQFAANVARTTDYLINDLGIEPGDRVAILDVDSADYLIALYAIAAADATAVPLNYRQQLVELEFQITNSKAKLLLVGDRYIEKTAPLQPKLALGVRSIAEFVAAASEDVGRPSELREPGTAHPFLICYTSGTTGRPKGTVLDQRALWLRALKYIVEFGIRPDDVVYVAFPIFHIGGLVFSLMSVMRGATLLVLPQFQLDQSMRAVQEHGVTFMATVPTMLAMMAQSEQFSTEYFGRVRLIMYGGSPMNVTLLRKIMSTYRGDMVQSFGQTEDLPQSLLTPLDHRVALHGDPKRLGSIGRPPFGVELRICDGNGEPVAQGEIGEIATRGGTGMSEYWGLPEETAKTLRDGWVFSGDLGYEDKDGFIYLAGRKRQMIIRGGENVYPAEVERVILTLPGVNDCAVVGIPDAFWGEIVAAVVVTDGAQLKDADIILHCKQSLATYRCPEKVFFRSELPYNMTGKVDRRVLLKEITGS